MATTTDARERDADATTVPEAVRPGPPGGAPAPDPSRAPLVLIAIVVMVAVVTYLGPILKPFLVAVFLFFSTRAAAGYLVRRGVPGPLAYLALLVLGAAAVAAVGPLAYGEARAFQADWPRYQRRVLAVLGELPPEVSEPLGELFTSSAGAVFQEAVERGVGMAELVIMTFFYLLFMVLGARRLPERVRRSFPGARGERVVAIAAKIGTGMERFMQVKTVVSLGLGACAAVLMAAFGLRGALLWGVLFFALNYITYIGSIIACVPPVVLAYLDLASPVSATVLAAVLVVNRSVWVDYVEIKLAGRHLNVDSILLFLWLAYWGWVWGVVGLILAFPMVAGLKIVLEQLETTRGWAVLMSDE